MGIITINASYESRAAVNFQQGSPDYLIIKAADPDTGAQLYKKAAELIKKNRKKYVAAASPEGDARII